MKGEIKMKEEIKMKVKGKVDISGSKMCVPMKVDLSIKNIK